MNLPSPTSKIGLKQANSHACPNKLQHNLHKIPPLPIFRKNLLNSRRLRQRLRVDGYKYFAKLPASGPEASKILNGLKRSGCVKLVQKFEFDPYLCDYSYLNDLRKICHRIRDISSLNLVIRRADFPSEVETIAPFISRFLRLKSIRIELPRTQNVSENGFIQLLKAVGKCWNLRSFESKAIEMPEKSERAAQVSDICFRRLKRLEIFKTYEILKKGSVKNHPSGPAKAEKNRKLPLKFLDFTFSFAREWANVQAIDKELGMQLITAAAQKFQGLEKLRLHGIRTTIGFEGIFIFTTIAALLPNLSHVECELLNCQISDMEIMACAHALVKLTQIKHFSLKVIQKPGISEDCIEKLAEVLSKLDHLTRFDIYFTRLSLHPQAIKALGKKIENLRNIHCSCSKESIHIYKRHENE